MEPAVVITGLSHRFGAVRAVDGIDLTVNRNEVFGIVGPDAAGKSTLMRLSVGVLAPAAGSVVVAGSDVHRQRDAARLKLGYMSQAFSLYRDLSVDENIWFFATLRGVSRRDREARASRLLDATGLAPFRKRLAGQLSGGMKQKLGLICTLVHEPAVLFLDEPTNGVDPVSRREFWEILGELRERITVIVTTPALDEAERCDRVALMNDGRLLAVDTPEGLRERVTDPVWEVDVDEPFDAAAVLGAQLPDAQVQLFGDRVHVVTAVPGEQVRALLESAGHTSRVRRIEPSLEDAYVRLVAP
ncbi:MAG: ABC transporter ATP-binding protein [Alphaproteobacteria bacterium]|nr:ABC transporter ATP-binding protein [Alphaproteobacteria bacterium]